MGMNFRGNKKRRQEGRKERERRKEGGKRRRERKGRSRKEIILTVQDEMNLTVFLRSAEPCCGFRSSESKEMPHK